MRLADLQLAQELSSELARLDEIAGPAELQVHDGVLMLSAEDTADFVEWKRERIQAQLRELGIDTDPNIPAAAGQPIALVGAAEMPQTPPPRAERVAESISKDWRQPAMPPRPTTIEEARAIATQLVLGPAIKAYGGRPASDDPDILKEWEATAGQDIAHLAEKRRAEIETVAQELMRGPAETVCSECDEPATTVIGGIQYCAVHVKSAPRPLAPEHLRLVVP